MDLTSLKAWELKEKLLSREISSVEIVKAHLDRIEKVDEEINAFISLNENAIKDAENIDNRLSNGEELGSIAGLPIALKDNIVTKNLRTTCGSKMLENFIPPYDAHVVDTIRQKGGIIIGKTNLDEFAMGGSTETSYFGNTKKPLDTNLVPGGSSGGSAAAIAANLAPLALGTDTGGSIRQPASFCGVVGIKPSYGLVSRYGVVSMANSLDQVGVLGRDIRDSLLMLNGIKGYDKRDSTSSIKSNDNIAIDDNMDNLKGMKIAVPKEYIEFAPKNKDIQKKLEEAIEVFEKAGAIIDYVSLPHLKHAIQTYMIMATAEISSNLSRFDGIIFGHRANNYESLDELYTNSRSEGFGDEVKRRIMMGTYSLSSEHADSYKKAAKVRTLIKEDFDKVYRDYDVVISLASPVLPFEFNLMKEDPIEMYKQSLYTVAVNIAGLCAMSIPMGFVDNLPVGLQIIGDRFREDKMIRAGLGFEKAVI